MLRQTANAEVVVYSALPPLAVRDEYALVHKRPPPRRALHLPFPYSSEASAKVTDANQDLFRSSAYLRCACSFVLLATPRLRSKVAPLPGASTENGSHTVL